MAVLSQRRNRAEQRRPPSPVSYSNPQPPSAAARRQLRTEHGDGFLRRMTASQHPANTPSCSTLEKSFRRFGKTASTPRRRPDECSSGKRRYNTCFVPSGVRSVVITNRLSRSRAITPHRATHNARRQDYTNLTFSAHGPFGPRPSVYDTFCPSRSSSKLMPWTAEEWNNRSFSLPVLINPKPLSNSFLIVPSGMMRFRE